MSSLRRVTASAVVAAFTAIGKDACIVVDDNDDDNDNNMTTTMQSGGDATTLQLSRWLAILDALESARAQLALSSSTSSSAAPPLSDVACVTALQHYHDVYTSCVAHVVLPASRWHAWRCGLQSMFATRVDMPRAQQQQQQDDDDDASGMSLYVHDDDDAVAHLRARLLRDHDARCAVAFWGTAASVQLRLARLLRDSDADNNDHHDDDDDDDTTQTAATATRAPRGTTLDKTASDRRCARASARRARRRDALMRGFARLCADARHVYDCYGALGCAQRVLLANDDDDNDSNNNTTTSLYDDDDDDAVDALLVRTLRRDVCVPSAWLSDDAAFADEVATYATDAGDDDSGSSSNACRRTRDGSAATLSQLRAQTLQSRWGVAAAALAQHEATLRTATPRFLQTTTTTTTTTSSSADNDDSSDMLSPPVVYDARGDALADAVAEALLEHDAPRAALAFVMHRVLSREAFVCTMNAARLDYALSLLHRWLASHAARMHRHRDCDGDACVSRNDDDDDGDVWRFVLQRHDVLLRIAVVYAQQQQQQQQQQPSVHVTSGDGDADVAMAAAETRLRAQLHVLRTIAYSLLHCWQLYVSTLLALPVNARKRQRRLRRVTAHTRAWLSTRLLRRYARALLHDVYTTTDNDDDNGDDGDDNDDKETTAVTASAAVSLTLECEVKLLVSDVMAFAYGARVECCDATTAATAAAAAAKSASSVAAASVRRQTRERLLPLLAPLVQTLRRCSADDGIDTARRLTLLHVLLRVLQQLERTRDSTHDAVHHGRRRSGSSNDVDDKDEQSLLHNVVDGYRHVMQLATATATNATTTTVAQTCAMLVDQASDGWLRCVQWCRPVVLSATRKSSNSNDNDNDNSSSDDDDDGGVVVSTAYTTSGTGGRQRQRPHTLIDLQYERRRAMKQLTSLHTRNDSGNDDDAATRKRARA